MKTDLKKLRFVTCPCCHADFKLVPDNFKDEQLEEITSKLKKTGNVTVCHHCAMPIQYIPTILDEWTALKPETAEKLPLKSLIQIVICSTELAEEKHLVHMAEPLAILTMIILARSSSGKEEGTRTESFFFERKGTKSKGDPSLN